MHVAGELPEAIGNALREAAITAFGSGVSIASWLGAGLIVVAIVVSLVTLRRAS